MNAPQPRRTRVHRFNTAAGHAAACAAVLAFPFCVTWPLGARLATHMYMPGDNFITLWSTAWQIHALGTPGEPLWDANIMHPYPRTLALSVLRLAWAPFGAAALRLAGNPVLMENLIILLSMGLSGVGVYALMVYLTRSPLASLAGALLFAGCPERFARLPHPHQINPVFLGPALLCLIHAMRTHRWTAYAGFVLSAWLQFLTSIYLFAFTLIASAAAAAAGFRDWKQRGMGFPARFSISLALILLFILPFAYPYALNRIEYDFAPQDEWIADLSARPADYLCAFPTNWLYGWTSDVFQPPRAMPDMIPPEFLFPGLTALGFLAAAVFWGARRGFCALPPAARYGLAAAATGFVFSFGPWMHWGTGALPVPMPAYVLYEWIPGFQVIRAPARFSLLVTLGLSLILAGMLSEWLRGKDGLRRWGWTALAAALIAIECRNQPLELRAVPHGEGIPAVHQWLAERPEKVIVCYPLRYHLDYMLYSTTHWKRLVNGWTGYMPGVYFEEERMLIELPSERSIEALKRRGAELIVIHRRFDTEPHFRDLTPPEIEGTAYYINQLERRPGLFEKVYDDGAAAAFRFRPHGGG